MRTFPARSPSVTVSRMRDLECSMTATLFPGLSTTIVPISFKSKSVTKGWSRGGAYCPPSNVSISASASKKSFGKSRSDGAGLVRFGWYMVVFASGHVYRHITDLPEGWLLMPCRVKTRIHGQDNLDRLKEALAPQARRKYSTHPPLSGYQPYDRRFPGLR